MGWDKSDDLYAKLDALQTQYPQSCQVVTCTHETINDDTTGSNTKVRYLVVSGRSPAPIGVLLTGGIQGNELIGPDALIAFATTYLSAIDAYVRGATTAPTEILITPPGASQSWKVSPMWIVNNLTLYIMPLVNPNGRDYQLRFFSKSTLEGRKNRHRLVAAGDAPADDDPPRSFRGVNVNRNFDILWDFAPKFKDPPATSMALEASPGSQDYRGSAPESEPETQNIVDLLDSHKRRITFLFDIHGQDTQSNDITYPWGWCQNQMKYPSQCFANSAFDRLYVVQRETKYYDQSIPADKSAYDVTNPPASKYGEYMAKQWFLGNMGLQSIAREFQLGASATGSQWSVKQSISGGYFYTGSLDDYFLSLDRDHMRAITIECAALQPDDTPKAKEIADVSGGLFAALDYIGGLIENEKTTGDPLAKYARHNPPGSKCPP